MNDQVPHSKESDSEGAARQARALARRSWPIRRYALGEEPSEDLAKSTSPDQRVAMVWPLTVLSWRLARLEIPDYDRRSAPGIVRREPEND